MSDGCFMPHQQLGFFMGETSFDVNSLRREHVWTCSVLGDLIYEMTRVTESGQQGSKTRDNFCCTSTLV